MFCLQFPVTSSYVLSIFGRDYFPSVRIFRLFKDSMENQRWGCCFVHCFQMWMYRRIRVVNRYTAGDIHSEMTHDGTNQGQFETILAILICEPISIWNPQRFIQNKRSILHSLVTKYMLASSWRGIPIWNLIALLVSHILHQHDDTSLREYPRRLESILFHVQSNVIYFVDRATRQNCTLTVVVRRVAALLRQKPLLRTENVGARDADGITQLQTFQQECLSLTEHLWSVALCSDGHERLVGTRKCWCTLIDLMHLRLNKVERERFRIIRNDFVIIPSSNCLLKLFDCVVRKMNLKI